MMNKPMIRTTAADQSDCLGDAIQEHILTEEKNASQEIPSEEYLQRCRLVGMSALAVLRMRPCVSLMPEQPGSLLDFFRDLALTAGVDLRNLLVLMGIDESDAPDRSTAELWARLCWQVGVPIESAMQRLRIGFVKTYSLPRPVEWLRPPAPALADRHAGNPAGPPLRVESLLREQESHYSHQQRADMRQSLFAFQGVFEALSSALSTDQEE